MNRSVHAGATSCGAVSPWRATFAGLSASLVGIGLARFAYTPLIPALIDAGWFAPAQAAYLGAANLAGYLAGALLARPAAARMSTAPLLRSMMVLATLSFFACAAPVSFSWVFGWRLASGLAGGALMVLAAPAVLPNVPPARQGLAGGVIFTGVGIGIAASGTLVPLLLRWGLAQTWVFLGALSLLLTLVAWRGWPEGRTVARPQVPGNPAAHAASRPALKALYISYGLNAVGLVPHMVFLVDFVARDLGRGLEAGAAYWVIFGLGAMAGPVLAGHCADRLGFGPTLRLAFLVQAVAIAWLAVSDGTGTLIVSSLVIGAFVPGIVPLVLGRVRELVPEPSRQQAAWSLATTAFALGQAGAAYAFSYLFGSGSGYATIFGLGGLSLALALAVDTAVGRTARRRSAWT